MSTLQERLDRIKAGFVAQAPAAAQAVMARAADDLRASGILDRLPHRGDTLPSFELSDSGGNLVRSDELLAQGPIVLTVYRGVW